MRTRFDKSKNTIYMDMDGVLADFDKFVLENLGRPWDYTSTDLEKDDIEMWDFLKNVQHLYLNLDPTPYAHELWDHVNSFGVNVEILTAIPRRTYIAEAEQDKKDWVEKHLGSGIKFNIGPYSQDKWRHASPGDILVDDRLDNIQAWINHGFGIGIRHPYTDHHYTMERLSANM